MKKEIIFTKDFANRKKDESIKIDSMLASRLVNIEKVARYKGKAPKKVSTSKVKKD